MEAVVDGLGGPVYPSRSLLLSRSVALRRYYFSLCLPSSQIMDRSEDGRSSDSFLDLGIDELDRILREVEQEDDQEEPDTARQALSSSSMEGQRTRAVELWNEQLHISSSEFCSLANVI